MKEEKKVYTAPELAVYGNVKAITQDQSDRSGKSLVGGDGKNGVAGWPS